MVVTEAHSGGIHLSGLTKSYGNVRAVRGVDVAVDPGETVAILGPNGAGKSTTIDMVLGLARPDAGSVTVFGKPPAEAVKSGLVGAMLQTGSLIQFLSVRELVTMVASLYPHPLEVDEVLRLTGTAALGERRTTKLSGGESQRVRFAIALVADPDLLVLDEPTAALDVEGRRDFWAAMRAVAARGKTIVFATHYLEEADAPTRTGSSSWREERSSPTDRRRRSRREWEAARSAPRCPRWISPSCPACRASPAPSTGATPSCSRAPIPMRHCATFWPATPRHATSRCAEPDSKRRSSS